MVFSSLIFLYAFFPLSLLAYFLCRGNRDRQNAVLLISSLVFYAWGEPKYVFLLIFMALVDWFCALRIASAGDRVKNRKVWLAIAVSADIILIGYFKYSGLVCSLFGAIPEFVRRIALPIGISFYTFQLMTYVIDVYRGEAEYQKSFFNVLLYAALFHQCIAGPIVRYKTVADELFNSRQPDINGGVKRFCTGLAKKTLLANPCGELADAILLTTSTISNPAEFSTNLASLQSLPVLSAWLGVIAYTLQIYLDFSAYSDMAIGLGKMLGFHYPENFNYPYISRSVKEFWKRWHISLSTFFRDYVYIPMGGSQCSRARSILNLFIVWFLTGLWHGASWNYVIWGLYFFVFLVLERVFLKKLFDKLKIIPHIYTVLIFTFGWIIFRFTDIRLGWAVFKALFGLNGNSVSGFIPKMILQNNIFLLAVSIIACLPIMKIIGDKLREKMRDHAIKNVYYAITDAIIPVIMLLLSTASLVGDSYNPFIYFQF